MLEISYIKITPEFVKVKFDLNGNENSEFTAIATIFNSLIQTYLGAEIGFEEIFSFGAHGKGSTEWTYYNETSEIEIK